MNFYEPRATGHELNTISGFRFLFIIALLTAIGCGGSTKNVEKRQLELVDSLVQVEQKKWGRYLDSLCTTRFDSLVRLAVDSILEERLEENRRKLQQRQKSLMEDKSNAIENSGR